MASDHWLPEGEDGETPPCANVQPQKAFDNPAMQDDPGGTVGHAKHTQRIRPFSCKLFGAECKTGDIVRSTRGPSGGQTTNKDNGSCTSPSDNTGRADASGNQRIRFRAESD